MLHQVSEATSMGLALGGDSTISEATRSRDALETMLSE